MTIPAATGDAEARAADSGHQPRLLRLLRPHRHLPRVSGHAACSGDEVAISKRDGSLQKTKITKLFTFSGLKRTETTETTMGDIVAVAGVEGITIGETITSARDARAAAADRDRRADHCDPVQREQLRRSPDAKAST